MSNSPESLNNEGCLGQDPQKGSELSIVGSSPKTPAHRKVVPWRTAFSCCHCRGNAGPCTALGKAAAHLRPPAERVIRVREIAQRIGVEFVGDSGHVRVIV